MVNFTVIPQNSKVLTEEIISCRGAIYTYIEWIPAILYYLKLAEN